MEKTTQQRNKDIVLEAFDTLFNQRDYAKAETVDPQMYVGAADAAIATGNLADAKRDLDKAAHAGAKNAGIDYSYGQLYDKILLSSTDGTFLGGTPTNVSLAGTGPTIAEALLDRRDDLRLLFVKPFFPPEQIERGSNQSYVL